MLNGPLITLFCKLFGGRRTRLMTAVVHIIPQPSNALYDGRHTSTKRQQTPNQTALNVALKRHKRQAVNLYTITYYKGNGFRKPLYCFRNP